MMEAVRRGGDRQELHERLRVHARASADARAATGAPADLFDRLAGDAAFGLTPRGARRGRARPRSSSAAPPSRSRPSSARSSIPALAGAAARRERARPRVRSARRPLPALLVLALVFAAACASAAARRPSRSRASGRRPTAASQRLERGGPRVLVRRRRRLRGQAHRLRRDLRLLAADGGAPRPAARHRRRRRRASTTASASASASTTAGPFVKGRIIDLSQRGRAADRDDRPGRRRACASSSSRRASSRRRSSAGGPLGRAGRILRASDRAPTATPSACAPPASPCTSSRTRD